MSIHTFHYVEGERATSTTPDRFFDVAFSNSVIEHVGPQEKQEAFAREVVRLGKSWPSADAVTLFPPRSAYRLAFLRSTNSSAHGCCCGEIAEGARTWVTSMSRKLSCPLAQQGWLNWFPNARVHVEFFLWATEILCGYSPQ